MRYRPFLLAACMAVTLTASRADEAWKGPGWYVVAYQFAVILWSGPYDGKQACEAAKPADNDPPGFSYDCSYFSAEPSD